MAGSRATSLGALALMAAGLVAGLPSCLERADSEQAPRATGDCARCHGDDTRGGTPLQRSAPPRDLNGNTSPEYPGVGAHERHLYASATHGAVACGECHLVPKAALEPGHADSDRPAELRFGALAAEGGRAPSYDPNTRSCSDSYCHGRARPVWTRQRPEPEICGTCHGLPPAAPHPQTTRCETCHGEVVGAADASGHRDFIAPERHVDGVVDVRAVACNDCHGNAKNPAPPSAVNGDTDPSSPGVGAHQRHLGGGDHGRPLTCGECHHIPAKWDDPLHMDGAPAEVHMAGVAAAHGHAPDFDRASRSCGDTWCHSPEPAAPRPSPAWTRTGAPLDCDSCHGLPPAAPHPQMQRCSLCHGEVVGPDDHSIISRGRHVDGVVDVSAPTACNACHGSSANDAPPRGVGGETATSMMAVGAHQAHLVSSGRARAVPCGECHVVPSGWRAPGHLDSPRPAELTFSGVAVAWGAAPTLDGATCRNTYCHGEHFVAGHASGGALTRPLWTTVDGTQAACGTCHGLPPPAPHPANADDCATCHENLDSNLDFIRPELHVDGDVTFRVP
ncbi:MAG: CxxxxCH/CxxCH domain-containing protein [Sorangiineae bacterium]|nr:CxxxxCH/CxxCH domain-containing protein [Polyangiaceae bacterium]MEB2323017.1 CxxxxCH/CxxCH domain-containing protein [Sorangiineae bacterium]